MADLESSTEEEAAVAGFVMVDEEGHLALSREVRQAMGIQAGSSLAYVRAGNTLLLIPDDHLAWVFDRAMRALAVSGLTAQDLLDDLPAARAEVVGEAYSAEFLEELDRLRATNMPDGNVQ